MANCPNCGAPLKSDKCEYCGAILYDFSCIDVSSPCYVKIKAGGSILQAKMYVGDLRVSFFTTAIDGRNLSGEFISNSHDEVKVDMELISVNGYKLISGT